VITSFVSGLQTISIGFSVPINAPPRTRSVISEMLPIGLPLQRYD
jgi:hypothetical protein